jgi:hypothetical protein
MDNQENPLQNSSFVLIVNPKFLALQNVVYTFKPNWKIIENSSS